MRPSSSPLLSSPSSSSSSSRSSPSAAVAAVAVAASAAAAAAAASTCSCFNSSCASRCFSSFFLLTLLPSPPFYCSLSFLFIDSF